MNVMPTTEFNDFDVLSLPASYLEPRWYAVYTRANHEKRLVPEVEARSFESFLPVYTCIRRWKDRRVTLKLPLFPGYVFVRMALRDRLHLLRIPSVVRLVGFESGPVALPDEEIEILRSGFSRGANAEPHPFLNVGRRVRITEGPFAGLSGILKKRKNNLRVIVALDLIQRSVAVDVNVADVAPLSNARIDASPP
jgi:transcription termination/antitermination protein NusG